VGKLQDILLPDIGDFDQVDVIEVLASPGDHIEAESSLITLESDKATMEVPSPYAGVIREMKVAVGDKISQGALIASIELSDDAGAAVEPAAPEAVEAAPPPPDPVLEPEPRLTESPPAGAPPEPTALERRVARRSGVKAHASPSVRRFARELGVDLLQITGTGPKGRILKGDIKAFVKAAMTGGAQGLALPPAPEIDFARFGEIETRPLSRIGKLAADHLHRAWLTVPHVTQFDEADITDLDALRRELKSTAEEKGVKLTFLSFLLKACAAALKEMPNFNASLDAAVENLVIKQYINIGVAVDTEDGLVVPVIRDVDKKDLFELAAELVTASDKARSKRLAPADIQGGTFTISSLGGIGGTGFTPIVNAPEVAILGVARSAIKPVWQDGQFVPRTFLPFSLSYDHRAIDGASGVRFTTWLRGLLEDAARFQP